LAKQYADYTIENFFDESTNLFYFTSSKQEDILLRKKDLYDSATPSGNATMVRNLQRLGHIFDITTYKSISTLMLLSVEETIKRYPSSLSKWAGSALSLVFPPYEIAVVGSDNLLKSKAINALFLPNKIHLSSVEEEKSFPILAGRSGNKDGQSLIYVCQNYSCKMPVQTIAEMMGIL
jgi:hypothetical protein